MATISNTTSSALSSSILNSLGTLSGTTSNVGAKIDVNALVTQLVAADRAPEQARLTAQQNADHTEISALGSLKSALSSFQLAAQALSIPSAFNSNTTTSSNTAVLTATSGAGAGTGSYIVQVIALAQPAQLASPAVAGGASVPVGTGTLTIGQGAGSFNVAIDSSNKTLSGIAAAINSASGNTGVQATILTETNGAHLVLTSSQTGATSAISVTAAGGDGGLAQFNYNGTTHNLTQIQAAQDSHIKIAGFDHYSATNVVSDAVTGLTLNLVSALPGTNVTVAVTPDNSATSKLVSSFVTAYNQLQPTIAGLDSYDAGSKTAGPLLGDPTLANIENQLRQDLSASVTAPGAYNTLAAIGVTKQADGTLLLDQTKLTAALAQSPDAVAQVFASGDGVATRLNVDISAQLQSGGALDTRNTTLQKDLKKVQDDTSALDERMASVQAAYTAQFTALDTLLAQLQTTSSFLTQQFAALQKTNSSA